MKIDDHEDRQPSSHKVFINYYENDFPYGIRTQMSAALTDAQLERALAAFVKVGRELELI